MRTSAPGNKAEQRGLTLVEVLAVIGVTAVMAAVVVTTAPSRRSPAEIAAHDFVRQVIVISDEAVTSSRTMGLSADQGLLVSKFTDEWAAVRVLEVEGVEVELTPAGEMLAPDPMPTGTLLVYRPPGEDVEPEQPTPPIVFSPTGEVTPFIARFEEDRDVWIVNVGPFARAEVTRAE